MNAIDGVLWARVGWLVGGRDARGNDAVVKKHLSTGDLYLHADLHGAASCALKRLDGLEPREDDDIASEGVCNFKIVQSINGAPEDLQMLSEDEKEEAAALAACWSRSMGGWFGSCDSVPCPALTGKQGHRKWRSAG